MGYSYSAKAGYVMDAIGKLLNLPMPNSLPDGSFWEYGREQADGAIVGPVWKPIPDDPQGRYTKAGSLRIDPNGVIKRFPRLPPGVKDAAQRIGLAMYMARHEPGQASFADHKTALLKLLENTDRQDIIYWWPDVEAAAAAYQREHKTPFLVLPGNDPAEVRDWLNDLG